MKIPFLARQLGNYSHEAMAGLTSLGLPPEAISLLFRLNILPSKIEDPTSWVHKISISFIHHRIICSSAPPPSDISLVSFPNAGLNVSQLRFVSCFIKLLRNSIYSSSWFPALVYKNRKSCIYECYRCSCQKILISLPKFDSTSIEYASVTQHLRCHDVPPSDLYDYLLQSQAALLGLTQKLDHLHEFLAPMFRHFPAVNIAWKRCTAGWVFFESFKSEVCTSISI